MAVSDPQPPPNVPSYKTDSGLLRAFVEYSWKFYQSGLLEEFFARGQVRSGQVTVSGTNTTGKATFPTTFKDAVYAILLTPKSVTGSPADGAYLVRGVAQTKTDFTVTVSAAPGASASVIFNYIAHRLPS